MDASLIFARFKTWGLKGGLSVLDQALYSGANFILSILLARWLLPAHYGVFSIAFAIYLFAYQIHNAIILEPMSVLGPARMHYRLADYLRDQVKLHFIICIFGGLVAIIVGLIIWVFDQILGKVIVIMGLFVTFMLLPLLMRRGFYLFQKPQLALFGSAIYAAFLIGGLWFVSISRNMDVDVAFPIIGIAGLASGAYLIRQIPPKRSASISIPETWTGNWKYGKWLVFSSILIALAAQVQTFVVGAFLGLADAGAFRALQNFIQPVILFFTALSAFLLPSMSYDFGSGNIAGLRRKGKYLLALFLVVSVSYALLLFIYGSAVETLVYDGKFSGYAHLIPLWGLVPIAGAFTYVFYFLLQSIQRPQAILIGSVVWSATSVLLAVVFSVYWGIAGATASVVAGYLFSGVAFAYLYRYSMSKPDGIGSR